MKVAYYECTKVTEPDFPKKNCLQIIAQFVSKMEVFGHFLEFASLDFSNFAYDDRQA